MDEYPHEILYRPIPLVALLGSGELYSVIVKNTTTRTEWNRPNTPALRYTNTMTVEQLPQRREYVDRKGSEIPHPVGILKANWMHKVNFQVPAAVAVFFEWDTADSKTKENDFITQVESVKATAVGPPLIVLIRNTETLDYGDDRFSALRKRLGLTDQKYFSVFVRSDEINGAKTVEAKLLRLTNEYFEAEMKRLKRHKEKLSKTLHQKLFARHHFKIAYYAEFMQDLKTALKYYYSSYSYLRDAKKQVSEYTEFKTLADFINFKVCLLYMERGAVADAVSQFHRHISYYKLLFDPDKEFHHLAWIARQYHAFGQLLDAFPKYQVSPLSRGWAHPGFYYHAAANTQLLRRKTAAKLCEPYRTDPEVEQLIGKVKPFRPAAIDIVRQTYVGQGMELLAIEEKHVYDRQWSGNVIMKWAIAQELSVNHAQLAIDMLLKALAAYQSSGANTSGVCQSIIAQMGHLHFLNGDIAQAKECLENVAKRYRAEQWWELLSDVLVDLLECAKKTQNATDIVNYSLELMSKPIRIPLEQKKTIQQQLLALQQDSTVITTPQRIIMTDTNPLLKCQVWFDQETACVHDNFNLQVKITCDMPSPIRFNSLNLTFSDSTHNRTLKDFSTDSLPTDPTLQQQMFAASDNLYFLPNRTKTFVFPFVLQHMTKVQCTSVELELGKGNSCISFCWTITPPAQRPKLLSPTANRPAIEVLEHEAYLELEIESEQPATPMEYFPLRLLLRNKHDKITSGKLQFQSNTEGDERLFFIRPAEKDGELVPTNEIPLPSIDADATTHIDFFYHVPNGLDARQITIKAVYDTEKYSTTCEKTYEVQVKSPFTASFELYNAQMHPIPQGAPVRLMRKEQLYLRVDLHSAVTFALELLHIDLVASEASPAAWTQTACSYNSADPIQIQPDETYTVWFSILPKGSGKLDFGSLVVDWRRVSKIDSKPSKATTQVEAPSIDIQTLYYTVEVFTPAVARLGEKTEQITVVKNLADTFLEFKMEVEDTHDSCGFSVSGAKQMSFRVNPQGTYRIRHVLFPLVAGRVSLPRVRLYPVNNEKDSFCCANWGFVECPTTPLLL